LAWSFDWDNVKAAKNIRKHGVSFEEAEETIQHSLAITTDDAEHSEHENRERTIGISPRGRLLIVVHAKKSEKVRRIISARKATRQETIDYEEEIKQRLAEE
jgi:uncharacterized DUF497 family protein